MKLNKNQFYSRAIIPCLTSWPIKQLLLPLPETLMRLIFHKGFLFLAYLKGGGSMTVRKSDYLLNEL